MRKRLLLAVVAMSLLAVVPADAQSDIDRIRADIAQATDEIEALLADLEETQRRGDELSGQYWQVQSGVQLLDNEIAASEQESARLAVEQDQLRDRVRDFAVGQYVNRSEELGTADYANEADRAAGQTLARIVVGVENEVFDEFSVVSEQRSIARAGLVAQRAEQAALLAEVEQTQASIFAELEQLGRLRAAVDIELRDLEAGLAALERAEVERQAAAEEQARFEEERDRALAAIDAARLVPTPAPTLPPVVPTPTPIAAQATAVPNPQPSEPLASEPQATAVPNPQPSEPQATAVPNPQPSEPFATAVPNPQPSEPFATAVPNPQPSEPFATAVPNPQPSEPFATAVPNPQPSEPRPSVTSGGGIVCPLSGPFTHTDDFSAPRAVGGIHRANDLLAALGTPVLAVVDGRLDHREAPVGGLSAHLRGDNGNYYFYTHLNGYENVGADWVAAGTVIGYVGETGNAPIPHLHFEIHSGGYGNYTNPYGPVRTACFSPG